MSNLTFLVGEFVFNMVKVMVAYDLIKASSQPRRSERIERIVQTAVVILISGLTTWNTKAFGDLFSNSMLWLAVAIMAVTVRYLYRMQFPGGVSFIYLLWVALHLVDFFTQSVVYYLLVGFGLPGTFLLEMDGRRGLYLLLLSAGCVWLGKNLKRNIHFFQGLRRKKAVQMAAIIVATILMVYFQRIYIFLVSDQYVALWVVFLLAAIITGCVGAVYVQKIRMVERERVQQVKLSLMEANYEQIARMYKEKAVLIHDEKHHLNVIGELLNRGEIGRAIQYTEEMTKKLEKSGTRVWADHPMLDLILNIKMEEAKNNCIDVDIKLDNLSGLAIEDVDICALISNLLDNAIEANQKIKDASNRWIKFYGERQGNLWIINSSNPIAEAVVMEGDRLLSSKPDKYVHGYGMESIRRVLDKYSGDVDIQIESERFALTLFVIGFK
ncbi:MAG: GHKL domain-containing protein [Lachnospiraceae bacterium]|nr:GHKL domain-containing protein [Lachnospiraceae bacterium]